MSETRHTPGPWSIGGGTGYVNQRLIDPSIAVAFGYGPEADANARLIAAAPDLLAACEAALAWVAIAAADDRLHTENASADLLRLQVAIAKAGGEPGRGINEAARAAIARARGET